MTDYTVLRASAETLLSVLKQTITDSAEPDLSGVGIDLRSPEQLQEAHVKKVVSVWLYQLGVQPDMLNLPPRRLTEDTYAQRPLPLELLFMITAIHPDAGTQLALTGRVLQVIDERSRLRGADLQGSLAGTDAELRVSLDTANLVESAELWYSLKAPFHLSVPIRMQVVTIDGLRPATVGPPVLDRRARIAQLVGEKA